MSVRTVRNTSKLLLLSGLSRETEL